MSRIVWSEYLEVWWLFCIQLTIPHTDALYRKIKRLPDEEICPQMTLLTTMTDDEQIMNA